MSLIWFLRLYHFYSLVTAYFLYEEVRSAKRAKTKKNSSEYFFFFFAYKDFFYWKQILKWSLSRSNHLILVSSVFVLVFLYIIWYNFGSGLFWWNLYLFWHTKLPNDIYYNLICVAVKFLKISFAWTTSVWKWRVTKILNLQHITLIFVLIILFLIFQCVLKFYYIQFNRLVNRSNCFHLMTSFMNLFVLFKMSVDINTWRAAIGHFGNVSMGSSICLFA